MAGMISKFFLVNTGPIKPKSKYDVIILYSIPKSQACHVFTFLFFLYC